MINSDHGGSRCDMLDACACELCTTEAGRCSEKGGRKREILRVDRALCIDFGPNLG